MWKVILLETANLRVEYCLNFVVNLWSAISCNVIIACFIIACVRYDGTMYMRRKWSISTLKHFRKRVRVFKMIKRAIKINLWKYTPLYEKAWKNQDCTNGDYLMRNKKSFEIYLHALDQLLLTTKLWGQKLLPKNNFNFLILSVVAPLTWKGWETLL